MVAIESYEGTTTVKTALELSPLFFSRPGELRHMEWEEINWEDHQWEIPTEKMKLRLPHIIPLATQALTILKNNNNLQGEGVTYYPTPGDLVDL